MNAAAPGGDSIVAEDEVTRVKEFVDSEGWVQ